ncbi:MAG TPA: YfcE family phosphodiesterase [Syntrophomonadaceae bacterium]|nr:YfcE family phosphodiesterase [Syntrophomonadaceae bacterium]HRX21939.1 YfcE family phosphodiesterase [Syntrophomonadaceae bacterium]
MVIGDTHGRISPVLNQIKQLQFDYMLFTGDFIADADKIVKRMGIKCAGVRGNCDPKTGCEEQIVEMDGKRFYLIHGHQYAVKKGYDLLWQRGIDIGADIVVFGHTHKAYCERIKGLWMINPGSPSYPRAFSSTYAVITIQGAEIVPEIIEF